jgi:hypothetical protein
MKYHPVGSVFLRYYFGAGPDPLPHDQNTPVLPGRLSMWPRNAGLAFFIEGVSERDRWCLSKGVLTPLGKIVVKGRQG